MAVEDVELFATLRAVDSAFEQAVARAFVVLLSQPNDPTAVDRCCEGIATARRLRMEVRKRCCTDPAWKAAGG